LRIPPTRLLESTAVAVWSFVKRAMETPGLFAFQYILVAICLIGTPWFYMRRNYHPLPGMCMHLYATIVPLPRVSDNVAMNRSLSMVINI
jgi:hypothetical protein